MAFRTLSRGLIITGLLFAWPLEQASAGVGGRGGVGSGGHGVGSGGHGVGSSGSGVGSGGSGGVGSGGHGFSGSYGVGRGSLGVGWGGNHGVGRGGHGVGQGSHGFSGTASGVGEGIFGVGQNYVRTPIKNGTAFAGDGANGGSGYTYPRLGNYPFGGNSNIRSEDPRK